jgi:hypothetical protein
MAQGLSDLITAALVAKITKYLWSFILMLGLPPSGRTLSYEDNKTATNMVSAKRPTGRSRHIDIQHFAIHRCDNKKETSDDDGGVDDEEAS